MNNEILNITTTVALWIVIVAWFLNLVDKYRKSKAEGKDPEPLSMDDIFDLSRMIVAQLDTLKGTNKEKKNTGVEKLIEAVKNAPGEAAKTVAENPTVASGAIEMAVNERREDKTSENHVGFKKDGETDVKNG